MTDDAAIPHEISFILDGHRYQQGFLTTPETGEALHLLLEKEKERLGDKGFDLLARRHLNDIQVGAHNTIDTENTGTALDFLAVLTDALDMGFDDPDDALAEAIVQAQVLDARVEALPIQGRAPVLVEMTWDNGGDDNAFGGTFLAPLTTKEDLPSYAFEEALENWLEINDHAYDFVFKHAHEFEVPTQSASAMLRDLSGTLKDNGGNDPDTLAHAWGTVLAEVADKLDAPAPAAARNRKSRP